MANPEISTRTGDSRTSHGTTTTEKPRFHWICCQCRDNVHCIQDKQDPKVIAEVEELNDICGCSHSRCTQCEVIKDRGVDEKGVSSNNLADKLNAEMAQITENRQINVTDGKKYTWECCNCREGPFGIDSPETTQDETQCPVYLCGHWRCQFCTVLVFIDNQEKNTGGTNTIKRNLTNFEDGGRVKSAAIGSSWIESEDGTFRVDPLGFYEQKLMKIDTLDHMEPLENGPSRQTMKLLKESGCDSSVQNTREETILSLLSWPSSPKETVNAILAGQSLQSFLAPPLRQEEGLLENLEVGGIKLSTKIQWRKEICLEKLARVQNKLSVRLQESSSQVLDEEFQLLLTWEHVVLPVLAEFIPALYDHGYTIALDRSHDAVSINIMTQSTASEQQKALIKQITLDLLPPAVQASTTVDFRVGTIRRLKFNYDDICVPRNSDFHGTPAMGHSIGPALGQGDNHSTSTLGPCLMTAIGAFWLMNFHPLEEASNQRSESAKGLVIEHPSPDDRLKYLNASNGNAKSWTSEYILGQIVAYSGPDRKTTRFSRNAYWEMLGLEQQQIVVDWALCSAKTAQQNLIRRLEQSVNDASELVISIGDPSARALVYSIGRTSGLQVGQVCTSPMLVSGHMNETGLTTREWYVKQPERLDDEVEWTRGGIGVSGDSGAAIVESHTNALYGQLWGRNEYYKEQAGPRYTFFTPIHDIFDDIQEKYPECDRPWLPHIIMPDMDLLNDTSTPIPELGNSEDITPSSADPATPRSIPSPEEFRETSSNQYAEIVAASTPGMLFAATPYAQEIDSDDLLDAEKEMAHQDGKRKPYENAADHARWEKRRKFSRGFRRPDESA